LNSGTIKGKITAMAVRAHVRHSQMLSASDYWAMLNMKSTAEITEFLKGTKAYSIPLEFLVSSTTHRALLESALNASVLDEAALLMSNLNEGPCKKFFSDLMLRFEADHLKNVFRRVHTHNLNRDILYTYISHIPASTLPFDRLDKCRDYASILEALSATPYLEVLNAPVMKLINKDTDNLFEVETAIDHYTETAAFNDLALLEKTERDLLAPFIGFRIDLYNIYNIHRCRWYYGMTTDEIMEMLFPVYYAVTKEDLQALAEAKEKDARFEILTKRFGEYSKPYIEAKGQPDSELLLETLQLRSVYNKAVKLFKTGVPSFHTIVSYFMMKRYEIKDVTKIVEIVRYGRNPRSAAKYLTRPVLDGGASTWL